MLDPFAGSGTTLVQALESGYDAVGVDIAAFNALLVSVKTREHDLESLDADVRDVARAPRSRRRSGRPASSREWFAPQAAAELLHFRSLIAEYASQDVLRVVLARAARSARLTTHFDLDFPRAPQQGEYWCHKHRRTCRPVETRGQVPLSLPDRHRSADSGLRRGARSARGRARAPWRRAGARARRPVRRGRHLAAVSRPDRLPRAAPLRLRAARARRPARAGARRGCARDEQGRDRGVRDRDRRRARARAHGRCGAAPPSASWSTTGASSTRRSSSVPACGSTSDSSGTSTAARAGAPASTTNRS